MAKLIIFHSWLCEVGGCETVLYNMCEQLKDWYDIQVIYTDGYYKQIQRLNRIVETEKYDANKQYECDIMIRNSAWGIYPDNINALQNKYIQMIHADYKVLKEKGTFIYKKWDKTTEHVACGEHVAKMFTEVTGYKCTPIKNILEITKPVNKIYRYIYAGRLFANDKNANLERIKTFLKMHEENNIKYELHIYTTSYDGKTFADNENVIVRKARYYDLRDEMADADYGLLFSDSEGLPCFVQECLQYGTPVIVTANGGCMELIKDGVNGYVVPMNMNFDINKIKKIPNVENYDNGVNAKTWCDFLGHAKYIKKESYKEEKDMRYLVKATGEYKNRGISDGALKKIPEEGETFEVDAERLEVLTGANTYKVVFVELVEEIKEEEATEENVKVEKESNKETKPKTTTKKKVTKKK